MNENDWSDPRIKKALFKVPPPPTAFQTEAFVSRVMSRIEQARSPIWVRWLAGRWAVPALGLGIATLFLSIRYSVPSGVLVVRDADAGDSPSVWVIPMDSEP